MESVSITYLGVPVCADAQIVESEPTGARVSTSEPMPVGTELEVTIEGTAKRARVTKVAEVHETGMTLVYVEEEASKPKRRRKKSTA